MELMVLLARKVQLAQLAQRVQLALQDAMAVMVLAVQTHQLQLTVLVLHEFHHVLILQLSVFAPLTRVKISSSIK
jgi:hypothetical protein